jgi:probable phosphoglycerate mutase
MRLYLIRHADPDYPNNTLTAAGHLEAAALARRLAAGRLDAIYSSPMPRAHLTAQYTADLTKLPVTILDWAHEVQGWHYPIVEDGEEIPAWDIPGEMLRADPVYYHAADWGKGEALAAHIQPDFEALGARLDGVLAGYGLIRAGALYRVERHAGDAIALFCHNGTALALLAHLLAAPAPLVWSSFWHAPSSVTTIRFEERGDTWAAPRALSVGDTSHLYEARLPIQPRGIRGRRD